MKFVSTVSSFLHIMIRNNVDFCKKRAPLYACDYFSFELYFITDDEMNKKHIFSFMKK